jgi:curli biogenesis system outer membrane secretion channel CsgG
MRLKPSLLMGLVFMSLVLPLSAAPDLPIIGITKIKAPVDDNGFYTRVNSKADNFQAMLETQLIKTQRFTVMERNRVDEILAEQGLNNEFGNAQTAQGGFNVGGVDYLVYGAITKFGQTEKVMATGGFSTAQLITEFAADIKVVDASTGEIRKAETAEVELKTAGAVSTGDFASGDADADPLSDVQRAAAKKVAAIIATDIFPLEVVKGGETIYLNYGDAILDTGDVLTVFRSGEELIDEATGINLGSEETVIGSIKVTEATGSFSKAALISGVEPERGDLARIDKKSSDASSSQGQAGEKLGRKI